MSTNGKSRKSKCVRAIRSCKRALGHIPTFADYRRWRGKNSAFPTSRAILRKIGDIGDDSHSWDVALKSASMSLDGVRRERKRRLQILTPGRCKQAVSECVKSFGHTPRLTQYEEWRKSEPISESGMPSALSIVRHCDPNFPKSQSWEVAMRSFDLPAPPAPPPAVLDPTFEQEWDENDCIDALRLCAEETGDVPSSYAYKHWIVGKCMPSYGVIAGRLSNGKRSWSSALKSAGFNPDEMSKQRRDGAQKRQRERAISALRSFVAYFGNRLGTTGMYLRWCALNADAPNLGVVLRALCPEDLAWESALSVAGVSNFPRIRWEDIPEARRNGHAPVDVVRCKAAIGRYIQEHHGMKPSLLAWRRYRANGLHSDLPSEEEIIICLDPSDWCWQSAISNALGITSNV